MPTPPAGNNNLIQFVVDLFYKQAIDPQSAQFLPKLIQGQTNPTYEPYVAGSWNPIAITEVTSGAIAVCTSMQAPGTDMYIVSPSTEPILTLSNVSIAGISNVLPQPATVTNDTVVLTAALSTYAAATAPAPLTITGNFSLTQHCCISTSPFTTCAAPSQDFVGTGTFAVTVAASSATVTALISVVDNSLAATVQSINWTASDSAANIAATIDIESIPINADRDYWNSYAEGALNSADARSQLVTSVGQMMGDPSTLDSLSALVTQALQSLANEAGVDLSAA